MNKQKKEERRGKERRRKERRGEEKKGKERKGNLIQINKSVLTIATEEQKLPYLFVFFHISFSFTMNACVYVCV